MAVRSRSIKKEYADEMNQSGVATQQEMDDAFNDHIDNGHSAEGLLPTPLEENQILKSYTNDGTLAWKVVKADDPQEGLTVIALPYYWDEARQKYLDNNTIRVINYVNTNGAEDEYMYYVPGIRSCVMPFNVFEGEKYCLVGLEYNAASEANGPIIEMRNITGKSSSGWGNIEYEYNVLYTVDLGTEDTFELRITDIDAILDSGSKLSSYLLEDVDIDQPAMIMILRRVWEEI